MKTLIIATMFGLTLSATVTDAETPGKASAKCQQLAHDYAKNPESLEEIRLKKLQFCINQTLAQREMTDPPTMLKGTIIEPLAPQKSSSFPASSDLQSEGEN